MNSSTRTKFFKVVIGLALTLGVFVLLGCAGPVEPSMSEMKARPAPAEASQAMETEARVVVAEDALGRFLKVAQMPLVGRFVVQPDVLARHMTARQLNAAPFESAIVEADALGRFLAAERLNAAPFEPTITGTDAIDRYLAARGIGAWHVRPVITGPDAVDRYLQVHSDDETQVQGDISEPDVLDRYLGSGSE